MTYYNCFWDISIQFRWQLETTNSGFWVVNVLLRKFNTLPEKRNENDKNTNFVMKNNKKMPKKYIKVLSNIFLWTSHTDPWCNMLQTLERWRKYIGVILSDEHTLRDGSFCKKIAFIRYLTSLFSFKSSSNIFQKMLAKTFSNSGNFATNLLFQKAWHFPVKT